MPRLSLDQLRPHAVYLGWAVAIIVLGPIWRSGLIPISPWLSKYGGDALWVLMIYSIVRFVRPDARSSVSALWAFGICALVEFSQLYHADWIDSVRRTRLGSLALGNVFNWPDIPAYAAGVLLALAVDVLIRSRAKRSATLTQPRVAH